MNQINEFPNIWDEEIKYNKKEWDFFNVWDKDMQFIEKISSKVYNSLIASKIK